MKVRMWVGVMAITAGCATALPSLAAESGADELWEFHVTMDMPGMPAGIPPMTNRVCVKKGQLEGVAKLGGAGEMDENCKTFDVKQSGNTSSYRFQCTGENTLTGEGEFTRAGDSYTGKMHAKGTTGGKPFEMKQSYSANRVGNCTYVDGKEKYEEMQARQRARKQ